MNTATALLVEACAARSADTDVLVIGGEAELPRAIREQRVRSRMVWIATDVREVDAVDDADGIDCRSDPFSPLTDDERFGIILLPAVPDRALMRRWIVLAYSVLLPDGILMLAGANSEGIRSLIADAGALFGPPMREEYRQKHRIARFIRNDAVSSVPAWTSASGIAPDTWQSLTVAVHGEMLTLATLPGVFAGDRLDAGTSLLLDHLVDAKSVAPGAHVLDVGCGAGAIGFAARAMGAGSVDMTDVNLLAVASVRQTIREQAIANARALASDVYAAVGDGRYDLIVSNPPFHRGKAIDYGMPARLIGEAVTHLRPGGSLLIVANAFLAYERLMERHFRDVQVVAATRRFRVLQAMQPH